MATIEDLFNSHEAYIRQNLIYNLPALLLVFDKSLWQVASKHYLQALTKDPDNGVRLQAISSLLEIMKQLGVEQT